ncbi:aspartate kinase [Pseudoalteromonas sp.]|uniref:aspartate kinase n=1 Tax=Pseudoalteromonas sp. TaxID=53249 RepID=UPI00356715E2
MALLVKKFGGTSVGSIERIEAVADLVVRSKQQGHQVVVVVSAMSGETNRLINLARQIDSNPSSRELDVLLTTGEQVSVALLAMAIIKRGHSAISLLADQAGIMTDNLFGKARIQMIPPKRLNQELEQGRIVILAGFQGRDIEGNITTLGRGGTDTTAVEVAAAINADECQIYTDVNGVYTTDPRIEPKAKRMDYVTFEEMLELASLGAKVLQIRSVEAAGRHNLPLRVLSSFEPDHGTLISYEENPMNSKVVSGIAFSKDEVLFKVHNLENTPQQLAEFLEIFSDNNIEIDMISNFSCKGDKVGYALTVHEVDSQLAEQLIKQNLTTLNADSVTVNETVAKISVVGIGMKSNAGVAGKLFRALANENINVQLISTSEIKVSVLVDEKYLELGVRALHSAFTLDQ